MCKMIFLVKALLQFFKSLQKQKMPSAIFCAFFLTGITSFWAQESTMPAFSQAAVKGFADELFLQGFYDEAENEYRRFLFMNKRQSSSQENTLADQNSSVIFSLSSIYNLKNNRTGANWLFENYFFSADSVLKENLLKLYSRLLFAERNQEDFSLLFTKTAPLISDFSTEIQFILPFSNKILNHDIAGAQNFCKEFLSTLTKANPAANTPSILLTDSILNESLNKIINSCSRYKTKSPGLALFLSALFPGAGRWYTGSFRGGLSSFIYVGSFTAGTVYSAIKFGWQDWRPYTFGSVALCFYAAELYGAFKSAQRYNQYLYNVICENTDDFYENLYK